jgi:hypothetical protein
MIQVLVPHEQHLVLRQRGPQRGEDRATDVAEAHALDLGAEVAGDRGPPRGQALPLPGSRHRRGPAC